MSYERRAYESVDDKSLYWAISQQLGKTEFMTERNLGRTVDSKINVTPKGVRKTAVNCSTL